MRVKLRDVCSSIYDGDHNAPPKSEHGIPFITISNIDANDGAIDFSNTAFVPEEYYESLKVERRPKCNDVLYSVVGSFGIPSLVRNDSKFVFQRHIAILRPSKAIDPAYLYYVLKDPSFFHWADAVAIGAAQRTVTLGQLRAKEIELPDMETQRHIADVLSAYDELIENNHRQIKLLEEAAQRLYREWFIDLKFPGHETTSIVDGLPEGWRKATLGELSVLITRGITPRYSETSDFLVLGQRCVRGNLVDLSCARRCECKGIAEQKMLKCGDVLINSTGTGSLGRTAQVWFDPIEMAVDSHVTIVRASSPELSSYLAQWAFANESFIESLHTGSTGQTELPRERVSSIRVLEPSPRALNQFNGFVSPMIGKMTMLQRNIAAAREARDRLLPKLMSGEIEV